MSHRALVFIGGVKNILLGCASLKRGLMASLLRRACSTAEPEHQADLSSLSAASRCAPQPLEDRGSESILFAAGDELWSR